MKKNKKNNGKTKKASGFKPKRKSGPDREYGKAMEQLRALGYI